MSVELPRGVRIAIVGQDGAGKSTLVNGLADSLVRRKFRVKKYYMGSGDGYDSVLKSILSNLRTIKVNAALSRSMRDIILLLFYTEVAVGYLLKTKKARRYSRLGYVVIFDRYPQRQFKGIYDGPKIDSRMPHCSVPARIFRPLFAMLEDYLVGSAANSAPDIVVKLTLPVHVSIKRKPSHKIEDVLRKSEITGDLRFDGALVLDVDASQEFSEVLREVEECVYKHLKIGERPRLPP